MYAQTTINLTNGSYLGHQVYSGVSHLHAQTFLLAPGLSFSSSADPIISQHPFEGDPGTCTNYFSSCAMWNTSKSWAVSSALELTSCEESNTVQKVTLFLILFMQPKLLFCLSKYVGTQPGEGSKIFEVRHFACSRMSLHQETQTIPVPLPSSRSELIAVSKDSLGFVSFPSFWKSEKSFRSNNISVINTTQRFC